MQRMMAVAASPFSITDVLKSAGVRDIAERKARQCIVPTEIVWWRN
jgi:hypothetical protein